MSINGIPVGTPQEAVTFLRIRKKIQQQLTESPPEDPDVRAGMEAYAGNLSLLALIWATQQDSILERLEQELRESPPQFPTSTYQEDLKPR
jgi:hypothetical protein